MHLDKWKEVSNKISKNKCKFYTANVRHQKIFESFCEEVEFEAIPFPFSVKKSRYTKKESRNFLSKRYKLNTEDKILLYTGRLSIQKNISQIFEVLKQLPKNYKLLLCGEYDDIVNEQRNLFYIPGFYFNHLRHEIKVFNQEFGQRIIDCGYFNYDELSKYYQGADLYISLSTYFLEDYGVAPLEAYSHGLGLLLSNWGGFSNFETLENTLMLDTCLSETSTAINLDINEDNINALIHSSSSDLHICEVNTKINKSFTSNLTKSLLSANTRNFKLKSIKSNWSLNNTRENLLFYNHFKAIASHEDGVTFLCNDTYLDSANKYLIHPRNDLLDAEIHKKYEHHYFNYFAVPLPAFYHSLMHNEKEIRGNQIFLRNSVISEEMIKNLNKKYPKTIFYYIGEQKSSAENFVQCEIVLSFPQNLSKVLLLSLDILQGDISSVKKFLMNNSYEKVFLLENKIEFTTELANDLNSIVATEVIKFDNIEKTLKNIKYEYTSFYLTNLVGDSFIDYYFLSKGITNRRIRVDECDFQLSPYHGLKNLII